jgi:uncharacterized membrane protein
MIAVLHHHDFGGKTMALMYGPVSTQEIYPTVHEIPGVGLDLYMVIPKNVER